jgi:starch synthase
MTIAFATSELTPIAKVGGLGDVAGALPKALAHLGVNVCVIMPRYDTIDAQKYPVKDTGRSITVRAQGKDYTVSIHQTVIPGSEVPVYLLENRDFLTGGGVYFEKSAIVNSFQEIERFLFFSMAVIPALEALGIEPDVLHCQDWHTGILPTLAKIAGGHTKTLFTIHNLANQGKWGAADICNFLGLTVADHPNLAQRDQHNDINLIQQGILSADLVNTVSPSYAQEILTPEFGYGLEGNLANRGNELSGILNGIDVDRFNPATDKDIPQTYSSATAAAGKAAAKVLLQKKSGLAVDPAIPVFGFVGRLTNQKGTELLPGLIDQFLATGAQLILLGTGDAQLEAQARDLAAKAPKQIMTTIGFDAELAQLIYAGSDFFLMPSQFEPCGLGQMIAMRYGTPPIVRATGGLRDTVQEFDAATGQGTGFIFKDFTSEAFWVEIARALEVFKQPSAYATLRTNDMAQDFSWDTSAKHYVALYERLGGK